MTDHSVQKKTLGKAEILRSRKEIERLFATGSALNVSPIKLMFLRSDENSDTPAKSMFVVPKRNFRKAHDRNRLRRRMKEAYRQNKQLFDEFLRQKTLHLSMAFLFTGRAEVNYAGIERAVIELLRRLESKL